MELKVLQNLKIKLMKERKTSNEKEKLTAYINTLNEMFTDMKSVAVDKRTTVENLKEDDIIDVLKRVSKRRAKTIEEYLKVGKSNDVAEIEKQFIDELIPEKYRSATTEQMDNFINEMINKENIDFKILMIEAKKYQNFDMAYISKTARKLMNLS
jgi:uncharacterized protein YqeY